MDTKNYNCFAVSKTNSDVMFPLDYGFQLILSKDEKALDLEPELMDALKNLNISRELESKESELKKIESKIKKETNRLEKLKTINDFVKKYLEDFCNSNENNFEEYVTDRIYPEAYDEYY